ncbi:CoA transferase [Dehalococcoidia bacterium]|nr:CoA transferase [Dehalococcoidia bacterium]
MLRQDKLRRLTLVFPKGSYPTWQTTRRSGGDPVLQAALEGLKVVDLTHYIAGPNCTKLLADYGAEVTKIERPITGDGARQLGPFPEDVPHLEKSALFLHLNANKRGMTLNLKSVKGVEILKELVQHADILVENFHPRVMPALGLNYDILKATNPELIMVSISDFGQTGPYRNYKGSEIVDYAR